MKFEEFLQEKFSEQYRGLDDDMVDAECDWMEALGIDEVIVYAEAWHTDEQEKLEDVKAERRGEK